MSKKDSRLPNYKHSIAARIFRNLTYWSFNFVAFKEFDRLYL